MMTRRKRLILLILILLAFLLLILLLLWFLFARTRSVDVPQPVVIQQEEVQVIPTRPTISTQEKEAERQVRSTSSDVVSLSKTFVTRYGSYSNEAEFANLKDVLPLMSATFARDTKAFIDSAQTPEELYGVTTSVVTVTVESKDEERGVAQATIMTQREEAVGSPQNTTVRYQEVVLTFVKEDDAWKVDSATWQ